MAFQVITDMALSDECWAAGILYYNLDGQWHPDISYKNGGVLNWKPSEDMNREGRTYKYAIYLED